MQLKKLHSLVIKEFLPPFFITLFISVFLFFLVEVVITYLDDLIGKGLRTSDLFKLFFYAWIAIIPQCIPLAVLLASIMCFGNLAENYELAAMKASGISLLRIIRPVFIVILLLSGSTFLFINFILPVVHLKSQTLLYDMRQKKPTVNIKEGVFYNAIENYSLRVGKKSLDKDTLYEIYIYDHTAHMGNDIQMYAKSGKITTTQDSSDLVLTLRDGNRYEESKNYESTSRKNKLSHLNYKQLQVNIPLEDYKLKHTNEELFKGNEEMLNVWQLDSVADSTIRIINKQITNLYGQAANYFYPRTLRFSNKINSFSKVNVLMFYDSLKKDSFIFCVQNALNTTRTALSYIDNANINLDVENKTLLSLVIEWHKKITVSFACIILFFIGAPLGAIIKKGGLGMPVVVSVFFFLAYYILNEFYLNLANEGHLAPLKAIWMPLIIFLPISVFLTSKAARDSSIFDATSYYSFINKFFSKKNRV